MNSAVLQASRLVERSVQMGLIFRAVVNYFYSEDHGFKRELALLIARDLYSVLRND